MRHVIGLARIRDAAVCVRRRLPRTSMLSWCALYAADVQKGRPYPQLTSREAMTRRIGKGASAPPAAHAHSHRHSAHSRSRRSEYSHRHFGYSPRHSGQPDARLGPQRTQMDRRARRIADTHERRHTQTHHTPTNARTHARALGSAGQAPTIPVECSTSCRDFLARCFEPDAAKRPVAKALLSHAWLDVCQS